MKIKTALIILIFLIILLLASCGGGNTSTIKEDNSTKLLAPEGKQIYFSAFPDFGGTEYQVSTQIIMDFENIVGKKIVCTNEAKYRAIK